jgi:hypothetical protein
MANVEIYKLRKTAPKKVCEYSVFDHMHRGTAPDPAHYIKEWAGEMHGTMPLTIPGRLMTDTPKDYHGGDIKNGDIAVVDGQPYYFDKLEGSKFIELDTFETESIRQAVHVKYGWFVDAGGAEAISNATAITCEEIDVPIGYLGKESDSGVYNDRRPFLPGVAYEENLNFIHPQFLKGDEARAFINLVEDLADVEVDRWNRISRYLCERSPITLQDLQDAREQFAPELLLPEVLQPLYKYIPTDADKGEVAYLAHKIELLDTEQRSIFNAVTEIGWQCGDLTEIINLTETLDCFELQPALNETMYGEFRIVADWDACEEVIGRLEKSEDPAERALVEHFTLLHRAVDAGMYGHHARKEIDGIFTSEGMLTTEGSGEPRAVYRGTEDLPDGYRTTQPSPETGSATAAHAAPGERNSSGDKPSVLAEIAESREKLRNKPQENLDKPNPIRNKKKSGPDL